MSEKKTYRIEVFQFVNGNSGARRECGFIFRHAALRQMDVPVASGSATPILRSRPALIVKASDAERVIFGRPSAVGTTRFQGEEGPAEPIYILDLASSERMPSGLQIDCPHCNTKGYLPA